MRCDAMLQIQARQAQHLPFFASLLLFGGIMIKLWIGVFIGWFVTNLTWETKWYEYFLK